MFAFVGKIEVAIVATDSGNVDELFAKIAKLVPHLCPYDDAAQYILGVHALWKQEGGKTADGKPFHSVRYLAEQLKENGAQVKALTSKLVGNTNIKPYDGSALVRYFLSHWPKKKDGAIDHRPLLSSEEIEAVAAFIETQLLDSGKSMTREEMATSVYAQRSLPGEPIQEVLKRNYKECDVQITVSPEHTLINPEPGKVFVGFRDLMNIFFDVERRTNAKRPLVWILDNGMRSFEDEDSRRKFMNVQQLKIRFVALREFNDRLSVERWRWLESTASFVVLDDRNDRPPVKVSRIPHFSAYDISFNDHAREWIADSGFRTLYGKGLEEIKQRTFSVLFNESGDWPSNLEREDQLRYFGFASFNIEDDKQEARGLELPALSPRYEDGFKAVCAAVKHILGLKKFASEQAKSHSGEHSIGSGLEAIEQLNSIGYRIYKLEQFLEKY